MPRPFLLALLLSSALLCSGHISQAGSIDPPPAQDTRDMTVRQVSSGRAPDGKGQLWAVVIGISSYKNVAPEGQLRFAHRDAQVLADFLRSPSGGGFPSNHIKVLLNEQATVSSIRTAIGTWLVRSAEPDDVIYIFFAGHGVVEGEREGYLLAHDSDPQNLYATALQVSELDRIITERLRARIVVLMADACHAGKIGWASRSAAEQVMINNYLHEVGKAGAGVYRLLASRADERSFEDPRWGGGHGAFTYFLLEGLRGKADKDKDNFVRVGELVTYLSEVVPEETRALQHPRMAGSIDPRLPLSVIGPVDKPVTPADVVTPVKKYSLEVRGTAGSEIYVDNNYRGRIRPNGVLVIEDLTPERHEVSVDPPNAESFKQTVMLSSLRTVLVLRAPTREPGVAKSSPLVDQIKQAVGRNQVLEPNGAWQLYKQMIVETPSEPQRASIEISLSSSLEEIGQRAINNYIRSSVLQLRASDFRRSAEAFRCLRTMNAADTRLEAKQLFCEARVAIDEGKYKDAIGILRRAVALDPNAGHAYNALGVAYEKEKDNDRAIDAFKRSSELAPQWSFPRLHLGLQYYIQGKLDKAEAEFNAAVERDLKDPFLRFWVVRLHRDRARHGECEKAALDLIRLAPAFASVHVDLGLSYEATRQHAKAADAFEAFLQLAATAPDAILIGYDVNRVRESAAKNRRLADKKAPSLRRP